MNTRDDGRRIPRIALSSSLLNSIGSFVIFVTTVMMIDDAVELWTL